VALTESLQPYVIDHFKIKGRQNVATLSEDQAVEKVGSRSDWFGVVDGMHWLMANTELMEEECEAWESFLWPVTVMRAEKDGDVLRQLARHQNRKHGPSLYIENTFFDALVGLRKESERLRSMMNGKKPTAKQFASACDGCSHKKDNMGKQKAATVVHLPSSAIDAVGELRLHRFGQGTDVCGQSTTHNPQPPTPSDGVGARERAGASLLAGGSGRAVTV